MLQRAASWCSEASFQRALEDLGLRSLRPGGISMPESHPAHGGAPRTGARRRNTPPPPPPRWMRRQGRPASVTGELHVLEALDAELLPDDAVLLADGAVTRAGSEALVAE
jgi:hypothetical protein